MNGVIYCRVSSKEQIEGTSLESQELACREYAREHGITILRSFVERGESAKFADRTHLLDLIDYCKMSKSNVQVLLVWKVDRFARNVGDHFNIKALLAKNGVRIVSVTEPIDGKPEGKLMETILAGFAQFDNDIRALRTVQGMKKRLQDGIFPWKPPLGYKMATLRGEKKTDPDVPSQPLFGLLQKAWSEFATGGYSKAEILRLMTNWGVRTSCGKTLSPQSLDNLFRNPYYAGVLGNPWTGEQHRGKHVALVSREDFARVQQVLARSTRRVPHRSIHPDFPLRGLVRCPGCNGYLTGSLSRGRSRRYPYYHCNNTNCGAGTAHPAARIHQEFNALLEGLMVRPEVLAELGDVIVQAAAERQGETDAAQNRTQDEIGRITRQTQALITMKIQDLITEQEFSTQKRALTERRTFLEAQRISGRFDPKAIRRDIEHIKQPLGDLSRTWEALPPHLQRRFQRALLPLGFTTGQSGTAETALVFTLFGDFTARKTSLVAFSEEMWNRVVQEIQAFAEIFRAADDQKIAA